MTANFALQRLPIHERFVGSLNELPRGKPRGIERPNRKTSRGKPRGIEPDEIKQAKSWQLRARTSLARPWQSQGKRKEAYDLLVPLYSWFTEVLDKKDLIKAKARLEELAA